MGNGRSSLGRRSRRRRQLYAPSRGLASIVSKAAGRRGPPPGPGRAGPAPAGGRQQAALYSWTLRAVAVGGGAEAAEHRSRSIGGTARRAARGAWRKRAMASGTVDVHVRERSPCKPGCRSGRSRPGCRHRPAAWRSDPPPRASTANPQETTRNRLRLSVPALCAIAGEADQRRPARPASGSSQIAIRRAWHHLSPLPRSPPRVRKGRDIMIRQGRPLNRRRQVALSRATKTERRAPGNPRAARRTLAATGALGGQRLLVGSRS